MQAMFDWVQAGFGWIEIVGGIVSLFLLVWFLIQLFRGRISLRAMREGGRRRL
jgi:hypothetical protein